MDMDRLCAFAAATTLFLCAGGASAQIAWKVPLRGKAVAGAAEVPVQALERLASRAGTSHVVIQFSGPVDDELKAALALRGVRLLSYLPKDAYVASIDRALADPNAAGRAIDEVALGQNDVKWIGELPVEQKMHPDLTRAEKPAWCIVPGSPAADPLVAVYIQYHADASLDARALAVVERSGARLVGSVASLNTVVAEMPASRIAAMAGDDRVLWIEPALPRLSEVNAENRVATGVATLQAAPYSLTGAGISAFIFDGGRARSTHVDFQGRLVSLTGDTSPISDHATHVAGTVGGGGVSDPTEKGMAPGVRLISGAFEYAGSGLLYTNVGDLEANYQAAISMGADVANNSIGSNVEINSYDCAWQGQYGVTDALIDSIALGSLGRPMIMVWAAGNERQGSRCDTEGFGDFYSVAPPAGAKNHISVGAINANDNTMTDFSSWGPMDDGRLVPVVSAPGCQTVGNKGIRSTSSLSDTAYAIYCGTSMASPTVSGIVALMLQDYRTITGTTLNPAPSMVRAMLAHSAQDLGNVGPDYQFGYGAVRATNAIDLLRSREYFTDSVSTGAATDYAIRVVPGQSEIRITLAWDDAPATPNAQATLVNDLDLMLRGPDGRVYYPWTLNPQSPASPASRNSANKLDNIEQVLVANPAAGVWTVQVRGANVPVGPQMYSVVGVARPSLVVSELPGPGEFVSPGAPVRLNVSVASAGEVINLGASAFAYRFKASDAFTEVPVSVLGKTLSATLPAARCGEIPEYAFRIVGSTTGAMWTPVQSRSVGARQTLWSDDFNTEKGWAVTNEASLTRGGWERAIPGNFGRYDPAKDFDKSGFCFVTENTFAEDLDGGPTVLSSPMIDLSAARSPVLSYARWFFCNDGGNSLEEDFFTVSGSVDNGATWSTLETASTAEGWRLVSLPVASSGTYRVKFTVKDAPNNSLTEAAVDAVAFTSTACSYSCMGDVDRSGEVDFLDYLYFLNAFEGNASTADVDQSGSVDFADFLGFFSSFDAGCR
jgi:hypothetical protein